VKPLTWGVKSTECAEPWCNDHLIDDGLVMHASRDVQVPMSAGGGNEQMTALVAVERDDLGEHVGKAKVRLELNYGLPAPRSADDRWWSFAPGAPMTPEQALQLSEALAAAARSAMGGGLVTPQEHARQIEAAARELRAVVEHARKAMPVGPAGGVVAAMADHLDDFQRDIEELAEVLAR
jgi:hypothetical protein